jgi:hypothetical protein
MDFDCSSSIPLSTKEDDILDNVKKVHTHIINGFELLITEKYKKYLNK